MRVHCHRKRGWGSGCGVRRDMQSRFMGWLAVHLDPDRAGRMDHHLFRIGYLYLDKRLVDCGAMRQHVSLRRIPRMAEGDRWWNLRRASLRRIPRMCDRWNRQAPHGSGKVQTGPLKRGVSWCVCGIGRLMG